MKIELPANAKKLESAILWIRKYASFIVFVGVILLYSALVLDINLQIHREPSATEVSDALKSTALPEIDMKTATALTHLKDTNVQVQTLFEQARQNPFQE